MKYHYFISYFSSSSLRSTQAISNIELTRNRKITTYKELEEIGKLIEEQCQRKDLVIINYILLRKEKDNDK